MEGRKKKEMEDRDRCQQKVVSKPIACEFGTSFQISHCFDVRHLRSRTVRDQRCLRHPARALCDAI